MQAGCLSMIRASLPDTAQAGSKQFPKHNKILNHSALSVQCRKTCIKKILSQSPADNVEKARLLPSASFPTGARQHPGLGRRAIVLHSVQWLPLGALTAGTDDVKTIVNSILGGYGLPKLPSSTGYKLYDDFDEEYVFEYPRSWVARSNHQRKGIYFADFNTSDKAVLEEFQEPADANAAIIEVVSRAVSPASEIGGDARLILPDERRIKSEVAEHDGLKYIYTRFPSETVTRSGYQIKRKNIAVAAAKNGRMYSLLASARSDQYNKAKEEMLQHIIESFRVRP